MIYTVLVDFPVWLPPRTEFANPQDRTVERLLNLDRLPGWFYAPEPVVRSSVAVPSRPVPKSRETRKNLNWYDRNSLNGGDQ